MRLAVLASGSKGNSAVIATDRTSLLVDCGLSAREILRRMAAAGEDPRRLSAILITHEHQDHVAGLGALARRLRIPVFMTEPTHRAWVRALTPRTTMSYAQWLDRLAAEREEKARSARGAALVPTYAAPSADPEALESVARVASEIAALPPVPDARCLEAAAPTCDLAGSATDAAPRAEPVAAAEKPPSERVSGRSADPTFLPAVEYFHSGTGFCIGDIDICPFTIPHDAADPCGFVFSNRGVRFGLATDLGYISPNVKQALRGVDLLLLESNHDLDMLKDGPYPWSVKQRVLSRVGHLSNVACAEFLERDYDGGAHTIVLAHLSESNNVPELARVSAEQAVGERMRLLGNHIVLAQQDAPLTPIEI